MCKQAGARVAVRVAGMVQASEGTAMARRPRWTLLKRDSVPVVSYETYLPAIRLCRPGLFRQDPVLGAQLRRAAVEGPLLQDDVLVVLLVDVVKLRHGFPALPTLGACGIRPNRRKGVAAFARPAFHPA